MHKKHWDLKSNMQHNYEFHSNTIIYEMSLARLNYGMQFIVLFCFFLFPFVSRFYYDGRCQVMILLHSYANIFNWNGKKSELSTSSSTNDFRYFIDDWKSPNRNCCIKQNFCPFILRICNNFAPLSRLKNLWKSFSGNVEKTAKCFYNLM